MVTHSIGRHSSSPPVMPNVIAVMAPAAELATVRPINQRRKSVHERQLRALLVEAGEPPQHEQCLDRVRDREAEGEGDVESGVQARREHQTAASPASCRAWCGARISITVNRVVAGHHRATMAGSGAWFRQYTDSTSAAIASTAMSRPFARERRTGRSLSLEAVGQAATRKSRQPSARR